MEPVERLLGTSEVNEIAGFAGVSPSVPIAQAMQHAASRGANKVRREQVLTRGQKYFMTRLKDLPVDVQRQIAEGKQQFTDETLYYRALILAGTSDMKINTVSAVVGTTNIDKGQVDKDLNIVIESISAKYWNHASETDEKKGVYNNFETSVDPAILNGELEVKVDTEVVLRVPFSQLFVMGDSATNNGVNKDKYYLRSPRLVKGGQKITYTLYQTGNALASGNNFLEINLHGPGIRG